MEKSLLPYNFFTRRRAFRAPWSSPWKLRGNARERCWSSAPAPRMAFGSQWSAPTKKNWRRRGPLASPSDGRVSTSPAGGLTQKCLKTRECVKMWRDMPHNYEKRSIQNFQKSRKIEVKGILYFFRLKPALNDGDGNEIPSTTLPLWLFWSLLSSDGQTDTIAKT